MGGLKVVLLGALVAAVAVGETAAQNGHDDSVLQPSLRLLIPGHIQDIRGEELETVNDDGVHGIDGPMTWLFDSAGTIVKVKGGDGDALAYDYLFLFGGYDDAGERTVDDLTVIAVDAQVTMVSTKQPPIFDAHFDPRMLSAATTMFGEGGVQHAVVSGGISELRDDGTESVLTMFLSARAQLGLTIPQNVQYSVL